MGSVILLLYAVLGILAISYCVARSSRYGVVSSFVDWLSQNRNEEDSADAELMGCLVFAPDFLFVVIVGFLFAVTFWPFTCLWDLSEIPKKRKAKLMLLKSKQVERQEERTASRMSVPPKWLIGRCGSTVGTLSPMGQVNIDGKLWEAVSLDGFMEPEKPVCVAGRKGRTLEVTALKRRY